MISVSRIIDKLKATFYFPENNFILCNHRCNTTSAFWRKGKVCNCILYWKILFSLPRLQNLAPIGRLTITHCQRWNHLFVLCMDVSHIILFTCLHVQICQYIYMYVYIYILYIKSNPIYLKLIQIFQWKSNVCGHMLLFL